MANGNIGLVPAAIFAEYVDDPFLEATGVGDSDSDGAPGESLAEDEDGVQSVVPDAIADARQPPRPQCLAVRPALAHRLYSHRLHVRAKAKLQRDRLLSGPMIDIYVGAARRLWTLHRNLLCHHSEQLEAELEGTGNSDRKDVLELPEHDPAGFELLVKWLYQGKLDEVSDLADANQKYDYAVSCHKLYLLCDRFNMPQLKNVAMDQFRKGLNEAELVPDAEEIDDIYRKSPARSPFRRLMVQIAARQIMDPDSNRDVESYRQCFENNADFAIELVSAIRQGTGGMLLDDPTDKGNECEYHDHEDGPHCNIKGKGKGKQARKAKVPKVDQSSAKSIASTSSDLPRHPHHPPPNMLPQPPPHPTRPRSSIDAGPPRRRLTSPAVSTVGTSTETAVASHPPSPETNKDWERLKRVIILEKPVAGQAEAPKPPQVHEEHRQSSEDGSRPAQHSEAAEVTDGLPLQSPTRRGIWEWARVGTGRLNIIGRHPHAERKSAASKQGEMVVSGTKEDGRMTESRDDFDIPSATATEPDNVERQETAAAAKIEGLGISSLSTISPNSFSQTKGSSDDLIANASETTGSPSPRVFKHGDWTNGEDTTPTVSKATSPKTPDTPTPPQRRTDSIMEAPKPRETKNLESVKETEGGAKEAENEITKAHSENPQTPKDTKQAQDDTPAAAHDSTSTKSNGNAPHVPTYKIALASSLLSPARRSASAAH